MSFDGMFPTEVLGDITRFPMEPVTWRVMSTVLLILLSLPSQKRDIYDQTIKSNMIIICRSHKVLQAGRIYTKLPMRIDCS